MYAGCRFSFLFLHFPVMSWRAARGLWARMCFGVDNLMPFKRWKRSNPSEK
jgi:hypothetical protein